MDHSLSRILVGTVLTLWLTLAAVGSVMAGTAMALKDHGLTVMVICAEEGAVEIAIDSTGAPVSPSETQSCSFCPFCLQAEPALIAVSGTDTFRVRQVSASLPISPAPVCRPTRAGEQQARAPPKEV